MSSSIQHILGLPREIRNIIYEYLDQPLEFGLSLNVSRKRKVLVKAHLSNAPLLSVLLVCTRFRDEYLEASCFRATSATLDWRARTRRTPESLSEGVCYDRALAFVRDATINVGAKSLPDMEWQTIGKVASCLKDKAPLLSSVQVALHRSLELTVHHALSTSLANYHDAVPDDESVLSAPAVELAGLPIRQVNKGFYTEYAFGSSFARHDYWVQPYLLGVYTFGEERVEKGLLGVEDLLKLCPGYASCKKYLETVPSTFKSEGLEIRQASFKIRGWNEKRCDGVTTGDELVSAGNSSGGESEEVEEGVAHWFD